MQTPPAYAGWTYGLMAVAVVKGTAAVAVGGNLQTPHTVTTTTGIDTTVTGNGNGIIIGTVNGGFSWTQLVRVCATACSPAAADSLSPPHAQAYPLSNGQAPTFTSVAIQNKTAWWVGGYGSALGCARAPSAVPRVCIASRRL